MLGLSDPCSHADFAALVGITRQRVAQLVELGVLPAEGTAGDWLHAYLDRLREQAEGRGQELTRERMLLTREHRRAQELRNADAAELYAPTALLTAVLARTAAGVADEIEATIDQLPALCDGLPAAVVAVPVGCIGRALNAWRRATAQLVAADPEARESDDQAEPRGIAGTDE